MAFGLEPCFFSTLLRSASLLHGRAIKDDCRKPFELWVTSSFPVSVGECMNGNTFFLLHPDIFISDVYV